MKKMFFVTGIIIIAGFTSTAQNELASLTKKEKREVRKEIKSDNNLDISYTTLMQFEEDFPEARNVYWKKSLFEEATFYNGEKTLTAYYDISSNLIGTTSDANYTDLSEKARKYIENKYPGYSVQHVIMFDDNENNETDMTFLGTVFEDADNYFVELKKDAHEIILKVDMQGDVEFFKKM